MSFEKEFLEMMPHTVSVELCTGRDRNDDKTFAAAISYKCRISGKVLSLRRQSSTDETPIFDLYIGGKIIAGQHVALTDADKFTIEDRVTLPAVAAWVDNTPVIFAIGRITDEDGQHHAKLQCGWMYHRQGQ